MNTNETWNIECRSYGRVAIDQLKTKPDLDPNTAPLEEMLAHAMVFSYFTFALIEEIQDLLVRHHTFKMGLIDFDQSVKLAATMLGHEHPEFGQYSIPMAEDALRDKFDPSTPAPMVMAMGFGFEQDDGSFLEGQMDADGNYSESVTDTPTRH